VQETASNAGGPSAPASSAQTAVVVPPPPVNEAPPTISGEARQGQTLTDVHGKWSNSPTSYSYQWQQCEGSSCTLISGATKQEYVPVAADVGHTIRVQETASNAGGSGSPATSSATAAVQVPSPATFGKTTIGASGDAFVANRKRVSRYALSAAGSVTKLSVYLAKTSISGSQVIEGIIYSDSGGAPSALLGQTEQLTFSSTQAAGWYDLKLASPLKLAAANYWIGVITGSTSRVIGYRFDKVTGSQDFNENLFSSGPTNPFGSVRLDVRQISLYATYSPG
jgi:hypothetical protein